MLRLFYIALLSLISSAAGAIGILVLAIISGEKLRRHRQAQRFGTTRSQRRAFEAHLRDVEAVLATEPKQ